MTQTAELISPINQGTGAASGFGNSVSSSGSTVVVGAPYFGSQDQGTAYVFVKPSTGWKNTYGFYTAQLAPSDLGGTFDDNFGSSVSISGNTVLVGEPLGNNNAQPGAAYLFVKPEGGWADMTQTAELTASDGAAGNAFGASLSVSNNTVVAGASCTPASSNGCGPGAAYVFVKPPSGWVNATQTAELIASDGVPNEAFGGSVSISGNNVVIGAPSATINGNKLQGAAYVFLKPPTGWTNMDETAKLTSSDGAGGMTLAFR